MARIAGFNPDSETATLEYYSLPGAAARVVEVPAESLTAPSYEVGQRVFIDHADGTVRSGRIGEAGLHQASQVRGAYPDAPPAGQVLLINVTGGGRSAVPPSAVNVACDLPISDPVPLLRERTNEGPWWYARRLGFTRALMKQRALFRGLAGLASSSIELKKHQVDVVSTILGDPVCRYILADEVGLGKTIEAGVVIRQHRLEDESDFSAMVVVPRHLKTQWEWELRSKFDMAEDLDTGVVSVCSPAEVEDEVEALGEGRVPPLVVVDEAHHLSELAYSEDTNDVRVFAALSDAAAEAEKLLLLSATPVLRDASGFLAMLNLIDRVAYPLEDLDRFKVRIQKRQPVAELARLLSQDIPPFLRSGVLHQLRGHLGEDPQVVRLTDDLESAWEDSDAAGGATCRIRLLEHIQESHRLYRRLIRTRRDDPDVAVELPRRTVRLQPFECRLREELFEGLEKWRSSWLALRGEDDTEAAEATFNTWVSSGVETPKLLRRELIERVRRLESGATPFFESELEELRQITEALPEEDGLRAALVDLVQETAQERLVVFLSDREYCHEVANWLGSKAGVIASDGSSPDCEVLLVPRAGEEGLNLQEMPGKLVHADLPFSSTRVEQRIGRIDRLAARQLEVQSIVMVPERSYQEAWAECLVSSGRVFEQSVASLQYLLAEAENEALGRLLADGIETFEALSSWLTTKGHRYSIEDELQRIRDQDLLDSGTPSPDENEDQFALMEDYEYDDAPEAFRRAVLGWAVDGLRFKVLDEAGQPVAPPLDEAAPFRLRGNTDHLPRRLLLRHLSRAIDFGARVRRHERGGFVTRACTSDRSRALSRGVSLLRVGHPLVDGLERAVLADDRGRAFAVWHRDPRAGEAGAFFRFDFVLEIAVPTDQPTLRRRADRLIPPTLLSVWLDADGEPIATAKAAELDEALVHVDSQSVVGADRWEAALASVQFDWSTVVDALVPVADAWTRDQVGWAQMVENAVSAISRQATRTESIHAARRAVNPEAVRDEDLERELSFFESLRGCAGEAAPRLVALGVVFRGPDRLVPSSS